MAASSSVSHNAADIYELVHRSFRLLTGEVGETITKTEAINSARLSPDDYFSLCVSLACFVAVFTLLNFLRKTGHIKMISGTGEIGELAGQNQIHQQVVEPINPLTQQEDT